MIPVKVNYNYFTLYKASSLNLKIIWSKRVSFFVFRRCRKFIRRSHGSRLSVIVRSDAICFYWNEWIKNFYYIDTGEVPGFFLSIKNHIFIARSEDTIFIFYVWGYWCRHGYWNDSSITRELPAQARGLFFWNFIHKMASRCEDDTVTGDFLDDLPNFHIDTFSELEEHWGRFAEVLQSDVEKFIEGEENVNTKKRPSTT